MGQNMNNSKRVGNYFDANWSRYLQNVRNNALYHTEMFATLDTFLKQQAKDITLADLGSGDSSAIVEVLKNNTIKCYIGVDTAPGILEQAKNILADVTCKKQFMCEDMANAVNKLPVPIEIIFTSYALHHLSYADKVKFIQDCQNKLTPGGYFIMVDGVLAPNQTRDEWLDGLQNRLHDASPNLTTEELDHLMEHPRQDDFPESIATFREIAKQQNWKQFDVWVDKEMYAFMVFGKG